MALGCPGRVAVQPAITIPAIVDALPSVQLAIAIPAIVDLLSSVQPAIAIPRIVDTLRGAQPVITIPTMVDAERQIIALLEKSACLGNRSVVVHTPTGDVCTMARLARITATSLRASCILRREGCCDSDLRE